jgi:hypothetical protein
MLAEASPENGITDAQDVDAVLPPVSMIQNYFKFKEEEAKSAASGTGAGIGGGTSGAGGAGGAASGLGGLGGGGGGGLLPRRELSPLEMLHRCTSAPTLSELGSSSTAAPALPPTMRAGGGATRSVVMLGASRRVAGRSRSYRHLQELVADSTKPRIVCRNELAE